MQSQSIIIYLLLYHYVNWNESWEHSVWLDEIRVIRICFLWAVSRSDYRLGKRKSIMNFPENVNNVHNKLQLRGQSVFAIRFSFYGSFASTIGLYYKINLSHPHSHTSTVYNSQFLWRKKNSPAAIRMTFSW